MREPTDLCLLCNENEATKKNSHIFSRFLSTRFLGKERKGFSITNNKPVKVKQKPMQDSPKENYILCPDCERYFEILETTSADTFKNWKMRVNRKEFVRTQLLDNYAIVDCETVNKGIIHLLIYSLFWRSSISSNPLFNNGDLPAHLEKEIREILLSYKSIIKQDLLTLLEQRPNFNRFPHFIITSDSFSSETRNFLCVPFSTQLIVDQFVFQLFENLDAIPDQRMFAIGRNEFADDCKFIILNDQLWRENVLNPMMVLMIEGQKRIMEELKNNPSAS